MSPSLPFDARSWEPLVAASIVLPPAELAFGGPADSQEGKCSITRQWPDVRYAEISYVDVRYVNVDGCRLGKQEGGCELYYSPWLARFVLVTSLHLCQSILSV